MLTPLLTDRGHHVIAPDLPCDDPAATFDDYAEVVCDALGRRDDVVVVGHSLAGHTIPLVAARRPVRRLVYLCALVPELGRSLTDQLREDTEMLNPVYLKALGKTDELRRRAWVDEELARSLLFGDTDDEVARATFERLRPQALYPYAKPFSLGSFAAVASTYIVCADDRLVSPQWSKRIAHDRLGAELVELPGSHSPFLSRPAHLADVLHGLAD
jgi:pimeloyl-ACP methyl ester carboxylesterase